MVLRGRSCRWRGIAVAVLAVLGAGRADAQTGRVSGRVVDADSGAPIRGATVVTENEQATLSSFTAVTDEKGRFALIGLRSGTWVFTASAPGYLEERGAARIQMFGVNPPVEFRLTKKPEPIRTPLAGVDTRALQQELKAAEHLLGNGQYDEAIAAYRALLEKVPALDLVHLRIGRAYRLKKDYAGAMAAYGTLLEADPANELAKLEMGLTELERGDLEAADRFLTDAARADRPGAEVCYALGEVKFARAEPLEAERWYRKAIEADPSWARAHLKLALIAVNKGDKSAGIAELEQVIAIDGTSSEAGEARQLLEQLRR